MVLKNIESKEDLIHKAMGWMLREIGKKDEALLCGFLEVFKSQLPRTTLRYASERISIDIKNNFMND